MGYFGETPEQSLWCRGFALSLSVRQDWGRAFSSGDTSPEVSVFNSLGCAWAVAGGCLWLSLLPRG